MTKDITEIRDTLVSLFKKHIDLFQVKADHFEKFEVCGTIPAMQGKQKVDGFYFGSVIPKPKDVRLYFFPIYTHTAEMGELPENLKKALKGKSCFHIKYLDDAMIENLNQLIEKAVKIYRQNNLLIKK